MLSQIFVHSTKTSTLHYYIERATRKAIPDNSEDLPNNKLYWHLLHFDDLRGHFEYQIRDLMNPGRCHNIMAPFRFIEYR